MQTILALDVGNSTTKLGCFLDGKLEATEIIPTEREAFEIYQDEFKATMAQMPQVNGVVVSSVVPAVKPMLGCILAPLAEAESILWLERDTLGQMNLAGVDLTAYQPGELGTDRVANLVGGHTGYPNQRVVVCDFGTTATFDLVEPDGRFIGGAICPGPRKFQTLVASAHAAQLYEVDVFSQPSQTPGCSTQASLENGLYYGYKGAILEILGNLLQQVQWPLSQTTVVFTGGFAYEARQMVTHEIRNAHIDVGLTLKGLYQIWELNRKSPLLL